MFNRSYRSWYDHNLFSLQILSKISLSKFNECWPVWNGSVPAVVLTKCDLTVNQSCFNCRHFSSTQVFFPKQFINRSCSNSSHKHSSCIYPSISFFTSTDKYRPRSTHSDQLMCIYSCLLYTSPSPRD